MPIKLVTFDALHTLLTPRRPIYVQYSEVFFPYLGVLSPDSLKCSFKASLKEIHKDKPVYRGHADAQGWWSEVIKRTAIGAGAHPQAVADALHEIVPRLMKRFSSKEGYKLFDDALPVLRQLRDTNIGAALISNADARMRLVLDDLEVTPFFRPIHLSEELGIEKPNAEIFRLALRDVMPRGHTRADECVHVGDELYCDYHGARAAGMHALLIRRHGSDGEGEHREEGEDLRDVSTVPNLLAVLDWVKQQNGGRKPTAE